MLLLSIYFFILILSIVIVKYTKPNCTLNESIAICVRFIKTIIKDIIKEFFNLSSIQNIQYPVYIGYNNYDIMPQNVENCFKELSNHFDNIYFSNYKNNYANILLYEFRVYNPHMEDIDYLEFIELLTRISEKILMTHFRKYGINTNIIRIDNFIYVNLNDDILQIAFAKNDNGIREIKNLRCNLKNTYYSSQYHNTKKELKVQWNDTKGKGDD